MSVSFIGFKGLRKRKKLGAILIDGVFGKSIPIAVVMLKANVDKMEAVRRLQKSDGNVRLAIEDNVLEL